MICRNCGAQLNDGTVFCGKCGTKVKLDQSYAGGTPPYTPNPQPSYSPGPQPRFNPYSPMSGSVVKKKLPVSKQLTAHLDALIFGIFYLMLTVYEVFIIEHFEIGGFDPYQYNFMFFFLFIASFTYAVTKCSIPTCLILCAPVLLSVLSLLYSYKDYGAESSIFIYLSLLIDLVLPIMIIELVKFLQRFIPSLRKGIMAGLIASVVAALAWTLTRILSNIFFLHGIGYSFSESFDIIDLKSFMLNTIILLAVCCAYSLRDLRKNED